MEDQWYYLANKTEVGPLPFADLVAARDQGLFTATDFVWSAGTDPRRAASFPTLGFTAQQSGLVSYQTSGVYTPITLTSASLIMLRGTKPWLRFISILLFIGAGLMIVGGLFALGAMLFAGRFEPQIVVFLLYPILGLIYVFPALFLGSYASGIGRALISSNPDDLQAAFKAQRAFWRFVGILAIAVIVVYLIGIAIVGVMLVLSPPRM